MVEKRKNKKIPSYYNLPFNKTILANSRNNNSNKSLDQFLQQSFKEKFDNLNLSNKGSN